MRKIKKIWSVINYIQIQDSLPTIEQQTKNNINSQQVKKEILAYMYNAKDSANHINTKTLKVIVLDKNLFVFARVRDKFVEEKLLNFIQKEKIQYSHKAHIRIGISKSKL